MDSKDREDNSRGCYCGLWKTKPDFMLEQGNEPGFCGLCNTCGKQGHTRHFPGDVPYTGSWCDQCFERTALAYAYNPMRLLYFLFLAIMVAIIYYFVGKLLHWH